MFCRNQVCAAIGAVLCLTLGISSEGQTTRAVAPEKLISADAVFYFTSDGLDLHDAAWKKTAAYEALYSSGVMKFIEGLVNWGLQQGQPEVAGLARAAFDTLGRKGFSAAISFPPGIEGPTFPYGVVVVHHGAHLKPAASQMVREMMERELEFSERMISGRSVTSAVIPGSGGIEIGWWAEGQHLVIVGGAGSIGATLGVASGKTADISSSQRYQKLRESQREVTTFGWLDAAALTGRFSDFAVPAGETPLTIGSVAEALGLKGLKSIEIRGGFDGSACWSETNVETEGPRTGLLAILDQKSISLADLPPLPVDSTGFSAASFDLGKGYDDLIAVARSVAKLGPPEVLRELENSLQQLPRELGLDVNRDLLDPLGNVVCLYDDPIHGSFGFGMAAAISVDDPATLRRTFDRLLGQIEVQTRGGVGIVRTTKQGRNIVSVQPRVDGRPFPFGVSFVIDDKWLVVGLVPQTVEAFLLRLDGRLPSAQSTESFKTVVKDLPKTFTGVTVTDPRKTYGFVLSWAPMLLSMAQMAMQSPRGPDVELPFNAADLPPAELVTRPLFPNVSVTTVNEDGVHTSSRTSLPSLPFMNIGGDGAATTGIAVALLLPAVAQAREAARRAQSRNNLKQLGLAMHNYHDTFKKFPEAARPDPDVKLDRKISWLASLLPYLDQAPLYNQLELDKAWDDDVNKRAMGAAVPTLLNPGLPNERGDYGMTHYVGMAGVGKDSLTAKQHTPKTGVFGYDRKTAIRDILDGTSNTIMITEASKDFGPWGKAEGSIRALTKTPYVNGPDGIGGPFRGGFHALLSDGSVRFISENIDPTTLEALVTCQGGEVIGDF